MNAAHLIDRYQLQCFVPLVALTREHLAYLLRDHIVETRVAGATLFSPGERDGYHVYLLHGAVEVTDGNGSKQLVEAGDEHSLLPLADHDPREHNAKTVTDCRIIRFERDLLDTMLCWDQVADYLISDIAGRPDGLQDTDWMIMLLRSNLFYKVPPMNMEHVLDRFKPVVVKAGDEIVRQGEVGDCCYVIKEGRAQVLRSEMPDEEEQVVAMLDPGRCFGDDALYREAVRNATVKMASDGVLMWLSKTDYQQLMEEPVVRHISCAEAIAATDAGGVLLDVRSQYEYEDGHCPGALNFPLNLLKLKSGLLDRDRKIVTYCNSGRRSSAAAVLLGRLGLDVAVMWPGIDACDPDMRRYLCSEHRVGHWIRDDGLVESA